MKCNIMTNKGVKEVKCYKTQYKNVVIAKTIDEKWSITHYQTGFALGFERFVKKADAIEALPKTIKIAKKSISKSGCSMKQLCKKQGIKQINF